MCTLVTPYPNCRAGNSKEFLLSNEGKGLIDVHKRISNVYPFMNKLNDYYLNELLTVT